MKKLTLVSIYDLMESPENSLLYNSPSEADIELLASSIKKRGLLDPIIITKDRFIISGHRRIAACRLLEKESVRCKVLPLTYSKNRKRFIKLLREANRQRVKKVDEIIHEGIVDNSENDIYERIYIEKVRDSLVNIKAMEIVGEKRRFQIKGNKPLLDASVKVINDLCDYWPLSIRQIHYKLLNDPPIKNKNDPKSRYRNDKESYHLLTNVITRGRLFGDISWEAIIDETRPFTNWELYSDPAPFINDQFKKFMDGYFRNYCQSQPNHIEILAEKLTLGSIIRPIAMKYRLPYTIGRGYSSINPRHDLAERFQKSGKMKLISLILSDLDPDGDEIAQSFARSMRDDFDIHQIYPIKVALTIQQISNLNLPPSPDRKAKTGSKNFNKYVERYGSSDVWELEALTPQQLQSILDDAISNVIDVDLFNKEVDQEKRDCEELGKYREKVFKTIEHERR